MLLLASDHGLRVFPQKTLRSCAKSWQAAVPEVPTPVDHVLLAALRHEVRDSDDQPEILLRDGGPAGLALMPQSRGVFPLQERVPSGIPWELEVEVASFSNFSGIDCKCGGRQTKSMNSNLKAWFLISERWTRFVDTWDANPYFSNAGIICKQVGDKIKRQATVDSNRSGV